MRSLTLIALIAALILGVTHAQAQSHFSARSDLVVLNVAVTNGKGAFISGLTAEAFRVEEEGQPQKVSFFAEQDAPATIGVLIDASGSMSENRDRVIAGVTEFARASHPDDEFLPLVFNEHVTSVLPGDQRFTSDPAELRDALAKNLNARGRTAFHDALAHAIDAIGHGRHERKALIVLSDGGDNESRLTFTEALERVLASNVVVYSIALVDPLALDRNPKALRRLADGTGGLAFQPANVAVVSRVFEAIAHDIRSRYTLAYAPPDSSSDKPVRRVRVTVTAPGHSGLKVRTRTGYLSDASSVARGGREVAK
jgi:Ca-activated chloride channel family protein